MAFAKEVGMTSLPLLPTLQCTLLALCPTVAGPHACALTGTVHSIISATSLLLPKNNSSGTPKGEGQALQGEYVLMRHIIQHAHLLMS